MLTYRYPIIAREGWPYIGLLLLIALVIHTSVNVQAASLFWAMSLLLVYLYRDPQRKVPAAPLGIVAPVDGRITAVTTMRDPYIEREAQCVSISMHLLGIYSARSPTEGKVIKQWHGRSQLDDKGVPLAENSFAQWIQTDEADDVVMVVQQRAKVQSPRCYAQSGERIGQGQRCGFIPLGASVDVFVPTTSRVDVKVGDTVHAGADIIATLVH